MSEQLFQSSIRPVGVKFLLTTADRAGRESTTSGKSGTDAHGSATPITLVGPDATQGAPGVRELVGVAVVELSAAGCDSPRLDAELLLAAALGCDRAFLLTQPGHVPGPEEAATFARLVERRAAREPIAYILGTKPFRRVELDVDRRVLIPRDCTETLVELALRELPHGVCVVDVGTGSGAIAAALAVERGDLRVIATENADAALAVARANLSRLAPAVELRGGDLLGPVDGPVEAVLANLPYVPAAAQLPPDVGDHEPHAALFAGADGLDAYRALLADVASRDVGPTWIGLEMGDGQGPALSALVCDAGFDRVRIEPELDGRDRFVIGTRSP